MAVEAALDVGSNSIKLLVADVAADGGYRVLVDEGEVTGLASGLSKGQGLDPAAISRSLACLQKFVDRARLLGAVRIVAAGTSALRDAPDAAQFIERVRQELGLDIRVLSGEAEAELSRQIALRELGATAGDLIFFDVGGGSCELTWLQAGVVRQEVSLQLGARRCTDAVGLQQPVEAGVCDALTESIQRMLSAEAPKVGAQGAPRLAGLGGTATTCVFMLAGEAGAEKPDPNLADVTLADMESLLDKIAPLELAKLQQWPGLVAERAPVIYAGLTIIAQLLHHYQAAQFTVVDRGLRYGLLLAPTNALPADAVRE